MASQSSYRVFRATNEKSRDGRALYELLGEWNASGGREAIRIAFSENGALAEGDTIFAVSERHSREVTPKTKTILVWE